MVYGHHINLLGEGNRIDFMNGLGTGEVMNERVILQGVEGQSEGETVRSEEHLRDDMESFPVQWKLSKILKNLNA